MRTYIQLPYKAQDGLNSVSTVYIGIEGMKCQSCVQMIENDIMDVIDIHVSLEKEEAIVTFVSRHCAIDDRLQQLQLCCNYKFMGVGTNFKVGGGSNCAVDL